MIPCGVSAPRSRFRPGCRALLPEISPWRRFRAGVVFVGATGSDQDAMRAMKPDDRKDARAGVIAEIER